MKEQIINYCLIYLAAINLISAVVVMHDKSISRLPRGSVRRTPERTFVILSALGGAIFTLLTMMLVHHKTKNHIKLIFKITVWALLWGIATVALLSL